MGEILLNPVCRIRSNKYQYFGCTLFDEYQIYLFISEHMFRKVLHLSTVDQAVQWLAKPVAAPKVPGSNPR